LAQRFATLGSRFGKDFPVFFQGLQHFRAKVLHRFRTCREPIRRLSKTLFIPFDQAPDFEHPSLGKLKDAGDLMEGARLGNPSFTLLNMHDIRQSFAGAARHLGTMCRMVARCSPYGGPGSQILVSQLNVALVARVDLKFDPIQSPAANAQAAAILDYLPRGMSVSEGKGDDVSFLE
jgi:hypothetical protein